MRPRLVLLLLATACGGRAPAAKAPPDRAPDAWTRTQVLVAVHPVVDRRPVVAGDTLLDEYLATAGARRHPLPALPGDVACYGGPALDGELPIELYVRRGIDDEAGLLVEDHVALHPDDLAPRRAVVAFATAPGVHHVRDGDGYVIGRVLVDDADRQVWIVRDGSRGVEVTAREATDGALRHLTYLIGPALAERHGLAIHTLDEPEDFAAAQPSVLEAAADNSTIAIKGELGAIAPDDCAAIFARFPPRR